MQPHDDFLPYFQAASRCRKGRGRGRGGKSGSDGGRSLDVPTDSKRAAIEVWRTPPSRGSAQRFAPKASRTDHVGGTALTLG